MKPFTSFYLLLLVLLHVCLGCEKEGPEGPQGPPGPPGNANVKTRIFVNQSFAQNPVATGIFQTSLPVNEVTEAIVQNGSVQVFIAKANNNNRDWTALPGDFTPDVTNPTQSRFYTFNYASNAVVVYTTSDPGYAVDLKVVVLAGP